MMGFTASAVDIGRDWWMDEARTCRPRWRVRSTNLDGTDEDGIETDEENIGGGRHGRHGRCKALDKHIRCVLKPHLCCFELRSENRSHVLGKQAQGKEEWTKRTPRIRCWPAVCVDEMDDSEDIENEED